MNAVVPSLFVENKSIRVLPYLPATICPMAENRVFNRRVEAAPCGIDFRNILPAQADFLSSRFLEFGRISAE
jgi:hypothetical protein